MSSHSAYSNLQRQKRAVIEADDAKQALLGAVPHTSDSPTSTRPRKQARFDHEPVEQRLVEDYNSERLTWANGGTEDNDDSLQASKVGDSALFAINSLIMAICGDRSSDNRVSAVLYDSATTIMYVMEDTMDSTHYDQVYLLLEQLKPDLIITSVKSKDTLINRINEYCRLRPETTLELLPSKTFATATAKIHLASVQLPLTQSQMAQLAAQDTVSSGRFPSARSELSHADLDSLGMGRMRLAIMKMGCWVNVDAPLTVCALGALVAKIQEQQAFGALPGDDAGVTVADIESLNLEQHMYISQDSLNALEVFRSEEHASLQSTKTRQGMSLFGILDTTQTNEGHRMLERWFLRPLTSIEDITKRHDAIELLSSHDNLGTTALIRRALKKASRTLLFVDRIKKGFGALHEWRMVTDSLTAAVQIKNLLPEIVSSKRPLGHYPILQRLNDCVNDKIQELLQEIMSQVDWATSNEESRICFSRGVDIDLDELKERLAGMQPTLTHLAQQIALSITPGYCHDLNVVCFPQLGYLLACTLEQPEAYNINVPDGWELQFFSDLFYFKDEHMRDLDSTFGDLHSQIVDREIDLIQELSQLLLVVELDISQTMEVLAELDCILAFSQAVDTFSLTRPRLSADNVLNISQGRHLVQECLINVYVPNQVQLGADEKSMLIMTGANGSGKTAYGKMAVLIVYMAQVGCFVPAASATIGIRTSILTCLNIRESVSSLSSSFMLQLRQISVTLRLANESSLVLVDELGKGTLPQDGTSLLVGVLQGLLRSKALSIVITHFRPPMLPTEQVKQAHMESIVSNDRVASTISFLYQCQPGPSTSSHAGACALQCGIPVEIVQRAHDASMAIAAHNLTFDTPMTAEDQAKLRKAESVVRVFLLLKLSEESDPMATVRRLLQ